MSDDDLIRRGDALECFMGYDRTGDFMDANPLPPDPAAIRILALIQKGGDAYAVDPRHAPHEASPGVTAGATQKGDAE